MKKTNVFAAAVSGGLVLISGAPLLYVAAMSVVREGGGITLQYYYEVFLAGSRYLLRFWKSLFLSVWIAAGQIIVSVMAGYGFAKCRFPGKNGIFFLLMVLMIMPLQVTLVPNYISLDDLGLLDTYGALALPAIFVPLGTFIMRQSFIAVPDEVIEASRLDGCGILGSLVRIAVPMGRNGLVCTLLLSFLDSWNMVEQPMVYLKDFVDYPISVALASVQPESLKVQLVCCLLVTLPSLLLFACFNRELAEGIALGEGK